MLELALPNSHALAVMVLIIVALVLLLAGTSVAADTLVMHNGDRITGTVVSKQDGNLTLETAYAGTITVQWSQVRQLISDQTVQVILEDDTRLTGTLRETMAEVERRVVLETLTKHGWRMTAVSPVASGR